MNVRQGLTVWLTGLPASGKSTVARETARSLREAGVPVVILDGDLVRAGLSADLGFSPADRKEQARRVGHVACLLNRQGVTVVVALVSPAAADRLAARQLHGDEPFLEAHIDCSLKTCEMRDPKGMYAAARRGDIKQFTGISAPYEAPQDADVVIPTDGRAIAESVGVLLDAIAAKNP